MIKNEKHYKVTKAWIKKLESSAPRLEELPESLEQPWLRKGQRESVSLLLENLRKETAEYEALKAGQIALPSLELVPCLPRLLIQWRIAKHWTQADLAKRLGLATQQIQRYENTDYLTANLMTLTKVAAALGGFKADVAKSASSSSLPMLPSRAARKRGTLKVNTAETSARRPKPKTARR